MIMKKGINTLTALEIQVLDCVTKECFYENGFDSVMWNDCFIDTVVGETGITGKQTRALLVSLDKKGYLSVDGGKDGAFRVLEPGQAYLIRRGLVDSEGYRIRV